MKTSIILILLITALNSLAGVVIKGANGVDVEFAALFDAKPGGLVALLKPDGTVITIPWEKIDIPALKEGNSSIYQAYEKALATQKDQPVGMGLAQDMLSLAQLPDAIKQAVKDPYNWPYQTYSYETTYTDSNGKTVTRTQTSTTSRYPAGYITSNTPFVILKRIRDAKDDKLKKELHSQFKSGSYNSYGVNTMLERIDYTIGKLPPPKMFPRDPQSSTLITESILFRKKIEDLITSDNISNDHQSAIKRFFELIKIE